MILCNYNSMFYIILYNLYIILYNFFRKQTRKETLPNSFYKLLPWNYQKQYQKRNCRPAFLMNSDTKLFDKILAKRNLAKYKKNYMPRPREIHSRYASLVQCSKPLNEIHHLNKLKNITHDHNLCLVTRWVPPLCDPHGR